MQIRNDRAPKGMDMGRGSPATGPRYNGAFAIAPSTPEKVPDDTPRVNGRYEQLPTDDPIVARRREWWRRAQQKYRDKQKEEANG